MFHRSARVRRGMAGAVLAACALAGLAAVAGCGSGGGPSWASGLGSGVTVVPPGTASPGNDSPNGVMIGVMTAISGGHLTDFCKYEQPSQQAACNSTMSQVTPAQIKGHLPTFKGVKLGYTAIDGDKALIGLTGTICQPNQTPKCFTNNDPAAILSSGKPFSKLWTDAVKAPANAYSLSPAIKINGNWYAYSTA